MAKQQSPSKSSNYEHKFLFNKQDYILMCVGLGIITLGFLLMLGGGDSNPETFKADEIYHPLRITIAPIIIMLGYLFEMYVILRRRKQ